MFRRSLVILALASSSVLAQSTTFTFQGSLKNGGTPANGVHDFRFRLFDAATAGNQVGTQQCIDNLAVAEGVFTATLDFGQQFATTASRFIEVEVRRDTGLSCANTVGFGVLTPRLLISAAPMATHAKSAFSLDSANGSVPNAVFVDNAGKVGVGTTTPGVAAPGVKFDVVGGAMRVENMGDQADLLWLASERSWVFRQEGTGAGTALKLQNIGGGGNKNFILDTTGSIGIGTTSPAAKLDVRGDVKLGSSGQLFAPGGEENLRVIRGRVGKTGGILLGTGFTVTHPSLGHYIVTFNSPFNGTPVVTAMTLFVPGDTNVDFVVNEDSSSTHVSLRAGAIHLSGSIDDVNFDFIAVGPR